MRDAKLEAMGLPTPEDRPQRSGDKPQMATDELVCAYSRSMPFIY